MALHMWVSLIHQWTVVFKNPYSKCIKMKMEPLHKKKQKTFIQCAKSIQYYAVTHCVHDFQCAVLTQTCDIPSGRRVRNPTRNDARDNMQSVPGKMSPTRV